MLHQVGAGTLGPVFRAHDAAEGRLVAVKAFTIDADPDQARRLAAALDELRVRGLDHPSIAAAVAGGLQGTLPWFAQAYIPAESLDAALRQYGPAPIRDALAVVVHLAGALDYAAASGVLHGTLHSRDILVAPDETHVIDLGVAQALERCGLRPPIRRPYAAPERIDGQPVTRAADIFSLGVVAFELFTGQRPVGFGDTAVNGFPRIEGAHHDGLVETFSFALAQAPDERYTSGATFVASLKRALGDAAYLGVVAVPNYVPPGPIVADLPASHDLSTKPHSIVASDPLLTTPVDMWSVTEAPALALTTPPEPVTEAAASAVTSSRRSRPMKTPVPPVPVSPLPETQPTATLPTLPDTSQDDIRTQPTSALETLPLITPAPSDVHELQPVADAPIAAPATAREPVPPVVVAPPAVRAPGLQAPFAALATALVVGLLGGVSLGYVMWGRGVPAAVFDTVGSTAPAASTSATEGPASVPPPTPAPAAAPRPSATSSAPASASATTAKTPLPGAKPASTPAKPPAAAATASGAQQGRLVLRTTPAGVRVEINGKSQGKTPLTVQNLPFGILMVRLEYPGYQSLQRRVVLNATHPAETLDLSLVRAPGAVAPPAPSASKSKETRPAEAGFHGGVNFESRPAGAKVFIDNAQVGVTPLSLPSVRAGSHAVRFELNGFRRWTASVRVVAGERTRVAASLEEETPR